jgi:septum formation protein
VPGEAGRYSVVRAPLVLASRSPQRRAILEQLGIPFEVSPADVDELTEGEPRALATENALRKARAVAPEAGPERTVLGVDTDVVLDGRVFGKARDEAEAGAHLGLLSGRTHVVWSAVALLDQSGERIAATSTSVTFRALDEATVRWYVRSGEWRERAGSYAIQGRGAALVERIDGDYWNVVGLPVALLLDAAPWLLEAASAR